MPSDSDTSPVAADSATQRLRHIHRAASELRRGVPLIIRHSPTLCILAAETASPRAIEELTDLGDGLPFLLLAPVRAAAVVRQPVDPAASVVALSLPHGFLTQDALRGFADPTAPAPPSAAVRELRAAPLPDAAPAALALVKIAQLLPALLVVTARDDIEATATRTGLVTVDAADILAYPNLEAVGLRRVAAAPVPLADAAVAEVVAFRTDGSGLEHLAIVVGDALRADAPLVRIHSECFTGDLLGSMRCDCGEQLRGAIRRMAQEGGGIVLYLAQEGRGIGLVNKLRAYTLQDRGLDTLDANRVLGWGADERNFLVAAKMLNSLGVARVKLLTNNPDKVSALNACGVQVVGREAHMIPPNGVNDDYLATKAARFGHMLD